MDIHNDTELYNILNAQIVYPLAEYLSKKIVSLVRQYIRGMTRDISTRTVRKYVTFDISRKANGCTATIYVDTDTMQTREEQFGTYGIYNKFISLDLTNTYGGQTISWHLVRWLEETGAYGAYGNNPIRPIGMFRNVYAELDRLVPQWIDIFARSNRLQIVRG